MKWIVVWWVIVQIPTMCPDMKPDPYTGMMPSQSCCVLHYEEQRRGFKQEFATLEEAQEFINNAPEKVKPNMVILSEREFNGYKQEDKTDSDTSHPVRNERNDTQPRRVDCTSFSC